VNAAINDGAHGFRDGGHDKTLTQRRRDAEEKIRRCRRKTQIWNRVVFYLC
jgi:hypothetical protein